MTNAEPRVEPKRHRWARAVRQRPQPRRRGVDRVVVGGDRVGDGLGSSVGWLLLPALVA
jgi:hypothetical protein